MFDEPIKCQILKSTDSQNPDYQFTMNNGDPLSKNELIDIGQNPWAHKYGVDGTKIDRFRWKFMNYTPDILDRYWQGRLFTATFRTIGLIIPKKYTWIRDPTAKTHFKDEFTDDLEVFDGRTQVLAQAYLFHERNPQEFNGLTQWNDNHFFTPFGDTLPAYLVDPEHFTEGEKWPNGNLKRLATQPMLQINMHEKKHGHGYRHYLGEAMSLLAPYVKPGYDDNDEIIPDHFKWSKEIDIPRWEEGYGARNLAIKWLNHLRARRLRGRFVSGLQYRVAV